MLKFAAVILLVSTLFGCGASSLRADKILFIGKDVDGVDHIHTMNPDGTGAARLTANTFPEGYASWSADGTKIVFEGYYDGVAIMTMNADGSDQRRLSPTPGYDVRPSFSPDGTKIVYSRVLSIPQPGQVPNTTIMTMNSDGTGARTILASGGKIHLQPRYSPNGLMIAFMTTRWGSLDIATMRANGTRVTRITFAGTNGDPFWSPDGLHISFGSNREGGGKVNIYTMDPNGDNVRQVTRYLPPYEAGDTSWSPGGDRIVYEMDIDGKGQSDPNVYAEIRIINANGTGDISTGQQCSSVGCAPRWQPR